MRSYFLCSFISEYRFIRQDDKDCFPYDLYDMNSNAASDYENCKQWCTDNNDCAGFVERSDNCYFKRLACRDDIVNQTNARLYLKELI